MIEFQVIFFKILVRSQMWQPLFTHPTETHIFATIFKFRSYSSTPFHIIVSSVSIVPHLYLGMILILIENFYQPDEFILKGILFLLIVLFFCTSCFYCLWVTPPPPSITYPWLINFCFCFLNPSLCLYFIPSWFLSCINNEHRQ